MPAPEHSRERTRIAAYVRVQFVHVLRAGWKSPPAVMASGLVRMAEPASAMASAEVVGRADSGVIPEPTVIVRMIENAASERPCCG